MVEPAAIDAMLRTHSVTTRSPVTEPNQRILGEIADASPGVHRAITPGRDHLPPMGDDCEPPVLDLTDHKIVRHTDRGGHLSESPNG
ncbi:MAG TPA: hypothetical protein DDZ51_12175 [Planctomycetaceae bacterium]|nr:hypothetical protein [Planctomycetaceae bacterium]